MNFKRFCLFVSVAVVLVSACSTEPEIDWDQLESYTLITCELVLFERDSSLFIQDVIIQRLRPLVGYAFDPDRDRSFGLPGAHVTISDSDSTYIFVDLGTGQYIWEGRENFVHPGGWYRLDITLPDGRFAHSEIVYPDIDFIYNPDTIWVDPDSVVVWSTGPFRSEPIEVEGKHFKHVIKFSLTPGAVFRWPDKYPFGPRCPDHSFHYSHLWCDFEITDTSLAIFYATDSLSLLKESFTPKQVEISYALEDRWRLYLGQMEMERNWPLEALDEQSNIEGAYGFFATNGYHLKRQHILALRK